MPVAQFVEHLTFNQGVRDSNSRGRTKKHQTVLTLSGAFLCCLSADSVHRAEIREPLRCFLLCKVQVWEKKSSFLPHFQPENLPQGSWCRNLKHKRRRNANGKDERQPQHSTHRQAERCSPGAAPADAPQGQHVGRGKHLFFFNARQKHVQEIGRASCRERVC